jgi:H+-transporting ATPase
VNDAPALKQAEVGIAVANATELAKAASSLALTNPGLTAILAAVKTSRCIHSRRLTSTLNKIIKVVENRPVLQCRRTADRKLRHGVH